MANVLGTLFSEIANAIRSKTGETGKMKPAEFAEKIEAIEGSGGSDYNLRLAESLMMRDATYFSGDATAMIMKGFKLSTGSTLGSLSSYSFAGFKNVKYMTFSDVIMIDTNAFADCTSLEIIDITVSDAIPTVGFFPQSFAGCTALQSVIIRAGANGLDSAGITLNNGANDTFYVYVPSAYYDTIVAKLSDGNVPADRYRKLEDYPEVDKWNETFTVRFWDGDKLVDTQTVKGGGTATTSYTKEGYKLVGWEPSNANITADTDCYAQFMIDAPFATASFTALSDVLRNGSANTLWSVGDTRDVPITLYDGSTLTATFEIRSVNTDSVIIVSKYAFEYSLWGTGSYTLNSTGDNYWENSTVRTLYENDIFGGLPTEMQSIIAVRSNTTQYKNDSGSYVSHTTDDKVWIPGKSEIANWYPTAAERIKYQQTLDSKGTSAVNYAVRDGRNYTYNRPGYVGTNGTVYTGSTNTPYSVNVAPVAMMLSAE